MQTLLALAGTFAATMMFGYWTHWTLHQSFAGRFNRSHMAHHQKLYPTSDYISDKYRSPGKDNTVFIFGAASVPMLAAPIVLASCGLVGWGLSTAMIVEMLMIGLAHDVVHDAFHIRNHWLNRLPAFKRWNALHFRHHEDMSTNYGIFSFALDKLFGTFSNRVEPPVDIGR